MYAILEEHLSDVLKEDMIKEGIHDQTDEKTSDEAKDILEEHVDNGFDKTVHILPHGGSPIHIDLLEVSTTSD